MREEKKTGVGNKAEGGNTKRDQVSRIGQFSVKKGTNDFGRKVTIGFGIDKAEGHDEDPGLDQLSRDRMRKKGPRPEVDLSGLPRLEVEDDGHRRGFLRQALEEASDGGIAASISVLPNQGPVDHGSLNPLSGPQTDPFLVGVKRRESAGF